MGMIFNFVAMVGFKLAQRGYWWGYGVAGGFFVLGIYTLFTGFEEYKKEQTPSDVAYISEPVEVVNYCPGCGAKRIEEGSFCPKCGRRI